MSYKERIKKLMAYKAEKLDRDEFISPVILKDIEDTPEEICEKFCNKAIFEICKESNKAGSLSDSVLCIQCFKSFIKHKGVCNENCVWLKEFECCDDKNGVYWQVTRIEGDEIMGSWPGRNYYIQISEQIDLQEVLLILKGYGYDK